MNTKINHLAVWTLIVVYFLTGWGWYAIFGEKWLNLHARTMTDIEHTHNVSAYILAFIASIVVNYTLAMLISRISLRTSVGKVGRPPRRHDFQRQYDLNPARCHFITVSGFKTARAFRTVGANRYSPAKIKRSIALNVCLLGECRLSMLI